jgi:hypothetical protein
MLRSKIESMSLDANLMTLDGEFHFSRKLYFCIISINSENTDLHKVKKNWFRARLVMDGWMDDTGL